MLEIEKNLTGKKEFFARGGGFLHKISWEAKYGGRSIGGWCKFPVAIKTEANYTATVM